MKKTEIELVTEKRRGKMGALERVIQISAMPTVTWIFLALMLVMGLLGFILLERSLGAGGAKLRNSYQTARQTANDESYGKSFETARVKAKEAHQVTVNAGVRVDSVETDYDLVVMRVREDLFKQPEKSESSGLKALWESVRDKVIDQNIDLWVVFGAKADFAVDLRLAQFTVDQSRAHVRVSLPEPKMTNYSIDTSLTQVLYKHDGGLIKNDTKTGVDLTRQMEQEAAVELRGVIENDASNITRAREAAVRCMTNLVRKANPGRDDLTVTVEFFTPVDPE